MDKPVPPFCCEDGPTYRQQNETSRHNMKHLFRPVSRDKQSHNTSLRAVTNVAGAILVGLTLSACVSTNIDNAIKIDPEQGSNTNIASLTEVVERNPGSPEAYNVRGTAYGRAGRISPA